MTEFFENQSNASNHNHAVTMARKAAEQSGDTTLVRGRSPYTYYKADFDSYVTEDEASETYVTKEELSVYISDLDGQISDLASSVEELQGLESEIEDVQQQVEDLSTATTAQLTWNIL